MNTKTPHDLVMELLARHVGDMSAEEKLVTNMHEIANCAVLLTTVAHQCHSNENGQLAIVFLKEETMNYLQEHAPQKALNEDGNLDRYFAEYAIHVTQLMNDFCVDKLEGIRL